MTVRPSDCGASAVDVGVIASADAWFPLSAAQRSRWFMYKLHPEKQGRHNNVFAAYMRGTVQGGAIGMALNHLAQKHAMLRARFRDDEDEPRQCIAEVSNVPLCIVQAEGLDESTLRARVMEDVLQPFDLLHGPAIRASVYVRSATEAVFALALDHIISDGWSYWRLLEEFGQLVATAEHDHSCEPDLAESGAATYRDYIAWQREWLRSPAAEKQLSFWRSALSGELPVLALPFARGRGSGAVKDASSFVTLHVPAALTMKLQALATRQASTLFTCLLAAYQILLHRYSDQDEILVGCPVPGRSSAEWDAVVGDFVNVIPVRMRFDRSADLSVVLRKARNAALRGMANQDYPFAGLVERLALSRTVDDHPIFQTLFTFQKARQDGGLSRLWSTPGHGAAAVFWRDIELAPFYTHQSGGVGGIDLILQIMEVDDGLRCDFELEASRFDATAVERFAGSFRTLLESMVSGDHQRVSELSLLSEPAREQLLVELNATQVAYERERLIHELFERQAQRTPGAVAVVNEAVQLSYEELNRRANQVAHYLIGSGVRPDDRVAICVERSAEMVIALLGILKAGGAYVPLDPAYPRGRLEQMLSDSAPVRVLTQSRLRQVLPESAVPVLLLDEGVVELSAKPEHNPDARALGLKSSHLAYVIYTSGSTGEPKGVAIEHRNTVSFICWAREAFTGVQLRRTLFSTSLSFDLAVYECWVPLSVGCTVHVVGNVLQARQAPEITLINSVPSALGALLQQSDGVPESVRTVNLAGEPLKRSLVQALFEHTHVEQVCNLYGPSETTTYSTWVRMDREQGFQAHIGRPIANTQIYILDEHRCPTPISVAGEIYIGGAGVARGYLNRPELTAERFVKNPFSAEQHARMYRTGDLGRYLPDGNIEYLGRNDHQVKVRGYRIELGEIEARLCAQPAVREAVVLAREDVAGEKRLVAYVVSESTALDVVQLREKLSRELPEYMVPVAYVQLETLPLTLNGKLDRKALPAPDERAVPRRVYEEPVGEVEQTLAHIWRELLGVEHVGRQDHFFELGGHSLLAVQVVTRLSRALGVQVSLRELFSRPVLSALAEGLSRVAVGQGASIPLADRGEPLLLSLSQQRLWFLDQLDHAASVAYHIPAALSLKGKLNSRALRAALDRIVERHESLRTRMVSVAGMARQVIDAPAGFHLIERDLSALPEGLRERTVEQCLAAEASEPFDLSTGPLIRGQLLRLREDEHILLVTQHHIVSDGWSLGVLVRELRVLYTVFSRGEADPLPSLGLQYADYAMWQRQCLQGAVLDEQVGFWREQLKGAPVLLELPSERSRPAVQSYAGGSVPVELSSELTGGLRELSRRHGTTLFMTLLSGWSVLLSRLSGQTEVVIGTPVANRQRTEVEGLIGFFVNTLALRVPLHDGPSVSELIARVRQITLEAFAHQDVPFEQVVEVLKPSRSLSHSPIFQVMLALNNTPDAGELSLPGLQLNVLERRVGTSHFDLSLSLTEISGKLLGSVDYARDLFEEETIKRWVGHLQRVLSRMVSDDRQRVSELSLLSEPEREQVLVEFNATAAAYERERLVHELFERQAQRNADAVAVEIEGRQLSYEELNRRANQVAHYLIDSGVRPDDRVAICVERSVEMVIGLLGTLKAGGAYVPLDPGYPRARLAHMLSDSAPVRVLTQSSLRAALPESAVPVLLLDGELAGQSEHNPDARALGLKPSHLAYVIYTSGSTGQPKGVMVEHRHVANLVQWHCKAFALRAGSRCSSVAAVGFDAAAWEIWPALSVGAALVLASPEVSADAQALLEWWSSQALDLSFLPTPLAELAFSRDTVNAGLRALLVGGDRLRYRQQSQPFALINNYGPTEATVVATSGRINDQDTALHIGRPIANTQVYILDSHLQPVPIGVAGEIHIGGAQVARGYLNRAELTAQRFIESPFGARGSRLYKSGDLARWRADGTIEYLGRNDSQVKIRGFRIELGEIEAQLSACEGVREAVVVAREDTPGDKRLVAYYTTLAGSEVSVEILKSHLSRTLASYMVPLAYVQLSALPMTFNGKLDRKALPAPDESAVPRRGYEEPVGEVEQTLARIWQELLGVQRVGRQDQFFEIGGHSLALTQLSLSIKELYGADVGIARLYESHTLQDMAATIAAHRRRAQKEIEGGTIVTLEI